GRAALAEENKFAHAGAKRVHGDDRVDARTKSGRVVLVDHERTKDEQLVAAHRLILLGGDDGTGDSGEEHGGRAGTGMRPREGGAHAPEPEEGYFFPAGGRGSTAPTSSCGRGITWTDTTSPTWRAACA